MASRGLVAFLGGTAKKGSEILDEQRKAKMEEERQRLLLQLREESEIRLAEKRDKMDRSRVNPDLSGLDGDSFVYRDNDGNEVRRRELTPDEKRMREDAANDREFEQWYKREYLNLQRRGQDISAQNARLAASSRGRGGSGEDDTTQGGDLERFANLLLETYEDDIKDLASKGVPRAEIRAQARQVASAALSNLDVTGELPSLGSIEDHFNSTLRSMYRDVSDGTYSRGSGTAPRNSPTSYTHVSGTPGNPAKPKARQVPYPARD